MSQRLLIVDDNIEFRKMLRSYLEKQDLNLAIFEASSAEMGVAKSSFTRPDIVLMDINLPQANGLAAIAHIKTDNPDCCVIVVTMFDTKEFKELSKKLNVTAFVGKTEIYDCLVPLIKKCLGEKNQKAIS
ncbi:MAG TPA: response regulator transcription factor [Candidatus Omnitrophota bacterium]|nr:response regulator transcription factor [Candidatus Omnitrophota bacterium]